MNGIHGSADLLPFTMSTYSLTFMAIQYDQTQHPDRIIDAAVYTNVWPTTTTELGVERQIGTTSVKERAITYTGYIMHNDRTREMGVQIAKELALRSERYRVASPNTEYMSDLLVGEGRIGNQGIMDDGDLTKGEANELAHPRDAVRKQRNGDGWDKLKPAGTDHNDLDVRIAGA